MTEHCGGRIGFSSGDIQEQPLSIRFYHRHEGNVDIETSVREDPNSDADHNNCSVLRLIKVIHIQMIRVSSINTECVSTICPVSESSLEMPAHGCQPIL